MTTPADYRAMAEAALAQTDGLTPTDPIRVDLMRRATVYALLALGTEPAPVAVVTFADDVTPAQVAAPKPLPRKRAAKKTTAPKETTK